MPLYFLRHGESQANLDKVFAGQRDNSMLTERGRLQAHEAGEKWCEKNIQFHRIISSPLDRARETAQIFSCEVGFFGNIEIDEKITEYDMGEMTGTPTIAINSRAMISSPGAENPAYFSERVLSAMKEYSGSVCNTLIVSHAGVGRMIHCLQNGISVEFFYDYPPLGNAEVIELIF